VVEGHIRDAGRVTKTIENYSDGDPTTGTDDEDVTVEFTYTADGRRETITAKQKSPSDDQTTTYVYGTTTTDSEVARSDLLRAVIYPDSDDTSDPLGDGTDNTYDRAEHKYNRQSQIKQTKDQNATVHDFDFDKLGRVTHDRITTLGSGVDGAVRRTSTTYEVRGLVEKVSTYDNATVGSGNVVNEVVREYNDVGVPAREYQEHDGAKDANTLYVGYNYDETASGGEFTKGLRPKSVHYPNGRLVHYLYGSSGSDGDNLNRLDAIKDDNSGSPGVTLASYTYLGPNDVAIEDLEEPDVKLDYFGGTSGTYSGFDDFDRVVDQHWYDYGASADRDRFKYGYDRASNRVWKENVVAANNGKDFDEFYTYDGMHRLKTFDRGDLNANKDGISGTPGREQDWGLDATGNWTSLVQKTSGATDLDQDRAHNHANEITEITATTGTNWADPVHDRAGNMTTLPKPTDLANTLTCKYDAWNRLVEVKDGQTVVGKYEYDALNRRVKRHLDSQSPDNPDGIDSYVHYFYNSTWQILETRDTTTESAQAETLQPKYQYIWSPRYIDAAILRDENTDQDSLCDDERLYYLADANFNVTTLLDTSGDAVERYIYDPYGTVTIYDATWSSTRGTSSYENTVLYTGREYDPETGLYYNRHRVFVAALGTFISRDPVRYQGSPWNLYRYVRNSPLDGRDPMGLVCTASLAVDPVVQGVPGTEHTCTQVEWDEPRDVTTYVWQRQWQQLTPPTRYTDSCGRVWESPGQWREILVQVPVVTQTVVHVTYAIELTRGPVSGIGGPDSSAVILGTGPVASVRGVTWKLVISPGTCPGNLTPIQMNGNDPCTVVQQIINSAVAVGQASNGKPYYLVHLTGAKPPNTCNSATWEILTGAGVQVPASLPGYPGWGTPFSDG